MFAYDETGRRYTLNPSTDKGGEGRICLIEGNSGLCAKLFKTDSVSKDKYAKVKEWLRLKDLDTELCNQVSIPCACLYSRPELQDLSTFAGYTMERFTDCFSLTDVYTKPLDYRAKLACALNLCIASGNLHKKGIIIGDFNSDNVLMFRNSRVRLIDTDSMQLVIESGGYRILRCCTALKPEFAPPEIEQRLKAAGKTNLKSVAQSIENPIFNENTDNYMLAWHIFALLMNGAAPYSSMADKDELLRHPSKTLSDVDLSRSNAAKRGEFIYAKKCGMRKPPDYAPPYDILIHDLRALFEKSFIDGAANPQARPGPADYFEALIKYASSLAERPCGHYMPSHYKGSCVWCALTTPKRR